jgi:hypothetical protein
MAGDHLIESYARDLARHLGGRDGAIPAETLDHLLESVAERVAGGTDHAQAVREAIGAFGTPTEVAAGYVAAGIGLSTRFTRAAGLAALMSAGLVAGALATISWATIAERSQPWDALPRTLWSVGIVGLVAGVVLAAVGAAGLLRRQGRVAGWPLVAVTFLGIAAITTLAAWLVWVWVTALAVGAGILAARLRRAAVAPRRAVLMAGVGPVVAAVIPWGLTLSRSMGTAVLDVTMVRMGVAVGLVIWASGVASLGWWLFREAPHSATAIHRAE